MSDEKCRKCDGCNYISNDDDGSPWYMGANLPASSAMAVAMGLVQAVCCPACNPDGKKGYVNVQH